MSRKDYELIAAALKAARNEHDALALAPTHDLIARNIARALSSENTRFDMARFLAAAGAV